MMSTLVHSTLEDPRTPLIVAFVGISAIVLVGHTTGEFYPWTISAFFLSMVLLLILAMAGSRLWSVLGSAILVGVGYRLYFNFHSPTPVGASSQSYPERFNTLVESGMLESVGGYYASAAGAPFQDLLHMAFIIMTGVDGYYGTFLYAILIGLVHALFGVSILRGLEINDTRILGIAAVVVLVTTESLRRAYWPRNQVIAVFFFLAALYVLTKYTQNSDRRHFLLLGVFSGAMAFSHRLPLALFAIVMVWLLALYVSDRMLWRTINENTSVYQIGFLVVFVFVLLATQLAYLGNVIAHAVRRVFRILAQFGDDRDVDLQSVAGDAETTAATEALPGMTANFYQYPSELALFVERGHGVWILLIAGFAWAYLFLKNNPDTNRTQVLILLAASATGAALTIIGVISIRALNPTRPIHVIEPVLGLLIVVAIWKSESLDRTKLWRYGAAVVLVVLLASQIFAMSAAPDYANSPRYYAEHPEAHAKTTICEYSSGELHADREMSWFTGTDHERCSMQNLGSGADNPLFNAEINPSEHETVVFRHDVDVYHGAFQRYRLTWNPPAELNTNYNSVYHNGQVTMYDS